MKEIKCFATKSTIIHLVFVIRQRFRNMKKKLKLETFCHFMSFSKQASGPPLPHPSPNPPHPPPASINSHSFCLSASAQHHNLNQGATECTLAEDILLNLKVKTHDKDSIANKSKAPYNTTLKFLRHYVLPRWYYVIMHHHEILGVKETLQVPFSKLTFSYVPSALIQCCPILLW